MKQLGKQTAEDHGVGYIDDVKLVETDEHGFVCNGLGHGRNRVVLLRGAGLQRLPVGVDAVVHIGHEGVEVRAAFAFDGGDIEKEIHQHGLATPDAAPKIKAFDGRGGRLALGKQPAQRAGFARQAQLGQFGIELIKRGGGAPLNRIVAEFLGLDQRLVTLDDLQCAGSSGAAGLGSDRRLEAKVARLAEQGQSAAGIKLTGVAGRASAEQAADGRAFGIAQQHLLTFDRPGGQAAQLHIATVAGRGAIAALPGGQRKVDRAGGYGRCRGPSADKIVFAYL